MVSHKIEDYVPKFGFQPCISMFFFFEKPPRECISIHVGQAGVQVASHLWKIYCLEHGILPNGTMPICPLDRNTNLTETIFREHEFGTFIPRALFIDLEPNCIDTIRTGLYRHLFHPDAFIAGKEDAGNNFARGYYTMGREYNGITMHRIRQMSEKCDSLQGFNIFRSTGGGCGSGFGSFLFDKLDLYFGRKSIISCDVIPSPQIKSEVVEPYNAVFANHAGDGKVNVSFIFDNESLSDICCRSLGLKNPNFSNYNRVLAQVISGMTSMMRYEGGSLTEFQTNLVPFPRIRYPIVSYAPLVTPDMSVYEEFAMPTLLANIFERKNQLIRCNPRIGKYMAMSFTFRGNVSPNEVSTAKALLRGNPEFPPKIRFVEWAPPGFKVNLCARPPVPIPGTEFGSVPRSVVAMMNTTAIAEPWECLRRKYSIMYQKRAFVHWYTAEGMEEMEFEEAHENMYALKADYADLERDGSCARRRMDFTLQGTKLEYTKSFRSYGLIPPISKQPQDTNSVKGQGNEIQQGQGGCDGP